MTTPSGPHAATRAARAAGAVLTAVLLLLVSGCAPSTDDPASTATAEASAEPVAQEPAPEGEGFNDPGGRYTMTVPATWQADHEAIGGSIEVWYIAKPEDGFAPNVNVLTEDIRGMSVEDYTQLSIANGPRLLPGFELLKTDVVTGPGGHDLMTMSYTDGEAKYLGVIGMGADGAVVATLTSTPERYLSIVEESYPYLLTLLPTDAT